MGTCMYDGRRAPPGPETQKNFRKDFKEELRMWEMHAAAKGAERGRTDTQTEKHREVLATLIPFGQSPAYMKGGSGKENKTSWKV